MSQISSIFASVAVFLVLTWLAVARGRMKLAPGELRYPVSILVIGLVFTTILMTCAVLSYSAATGGPRIAGVFTCLALIGVYVLLEYFLVRFTITAEGIWYRTVFHRRGFVMWSKVRRVRWSAGFKWFALSLEGSSPVHVSVALGGLPEFAAAVLRHVPPERIDPRSAAVVRQTAAGHPPPIR